MAENQRQDAENVAVDRWNVGTLRTAVSAVLYGSIWDGFNGPTGVSKDEALDFAGELALFVQRLIRQYELHIDGSDDG